MYKDRYLADVNKWKYVLNMRSDALINAGCNSDGPKVAKFLGY